MKWPSERPRMESSWCWVQEIVQFCFVGILKKYKIIMMMQLIIKRVSVFWIRNFDFRYLNSQKEYPNARFQDFKMNFYTGFPLGLENLEKWEGIFQSGKSQGILTRLEKSGKITQNTGKLREFQTNIICYFSVIAKWICVLFGKFDQV